MSISLPETGVWRFDAFVLDTQCYQLRSGDQVIRVEPQVFDVLTQLVRNSHRFVTKEELFDSVWGGRFVGEAALTSRIKAARRALGDDGESQRYIRTVRGRGYQFVGTVLGQHEADPTPPRQHIAFCRAADGVRLAYAVAGEGPPLVRAANWMTHLGYDIESPVWKHWVRDLSLEYRFIRYDERGCGLSDWDATDFTFDDWVTDLESVVEALGLERFPLLGVSQGGAVAVAYAAATLSGSAAWCCAAGMHAAERCGPSASRKSELPHWISTSPGWDGDVTIRRSVRCSPPSFCPTAPAPTGLRSINCSGAQRRRRTLSDSSSSSAASMCVTKPGGWRARH